ncbi:hypothetical protein CFC21_107664 [Triticum aestivum]|uniref:Bowman-Birk serine protease inhibitors family domain-containing protein n=2 Tax=Triticum aestivum TaxID=4565 RepID=A0A9R1NAU0_WHEAT|nr:hypothetical protein CFC21_107664 [Triticum aestivum]
MAPRSAALALKAAAVAAILAMLVAPSLGRCGHPQAPAPAAPPPPTPTPPPPPPPPAPVPGPGPGPTISCNDCFSQCYSPCEASIASNCSSYCDGVEYACNSCKMDVTEGCKKANNCTGSCDECNFDPSPSCVSPCTTRYCDLCRYGLGQQCRETCQKECSAPKCVPWSPQN